MSRQKILVVFSLFMSLCLFIYSNWPDDQVHLIFCDVGQGDAILLTSGFHQVLIDAGPDASVVSCLDQHLPFWDRSLDLVIATHMDYDHIGGMAEVLKRYFIKDILATSLSGETETILAFRKALLEEKISGSNVYLVTDSFQTLLFDQIEMTTHVPGVEQSDNLGALIDLSETMLSDFNDQESEVVKDKNSLSIATFLNVYNTSIVLTGDLPIEEELAMIKRGLIEEATILKAGHHGAKTSSSMEFLTKIRPEIVIISVGKNNKYDHPAPQVIKNLVDMGVEILRTDSMGSVEVVISKDGYDIQ